MINKIFSFLKSQPAFNLKDTIDKLKLQGTFYKKVIGGKNELIGDECTLYLSIVNENTFDYNLNVYNDEYQFSSKEININSSLSLDTWETISFPVTNDRGFKICTEKGREVLIWEFNRDFFMFIFFLDESIQKAKKEFCSILVNLISSYEYATNYEKASKTAGNEDYITGLDVIDDISEFLDQNYSPIYGAKDDTEPVNINKINPNKVDPLVSALTNQMGGLKIKQLNFTKSFPNAKCLFESKGILHKYDKTKDELIIVSEKAVLGIYSVGNFQSYLVADEIGHALSHTFTGISQEVNLITNRNENLIMWLSKDDLSSIERTAYNFVFLEDEKVDLFRKVIAKSQYEASNQDKFESLKEEDQHWLENENLTDDDGGEEDDNIEMEMDNEYQESTSDQINKITAQAYLHDRTFVVRDNNTIGVYKTDEEDVLTHLANLPAVVKYEDKDLNLKNAQMFYSDTNMIFLDKKNPNSAFRYDLGKGKIVEEWTAEDMKGIEQITMERKFDQMTDNQVILGVNKNNLFAMDARVNKKNKVVSTKSYKTNPKMNCLATTDFGGVATGSLNGEIRLYDGIGKNAKTLLPCFGDTIKAIDVTADGKYILGTCDKYLILVPSTCKGDKTGFQAQMGKEKPNPKTLKIKPIDMNKYSLETLTFKPAKFNVNKNDGETNIITSMGDYVIIWNFSKIKKGILDDYKIKKVNQTVVENQFKFNRNQIVVTMENKLRIQNQKMLFSEK